MTREVLLTLHVLGACVLLGTGAGIAFFMLVSHRSRDPRLIAHVAGIVVLADAIFTILDNRDRAAAMGRQGRDLAIERFAWTSYLNRLADLYASIIGQHAS